MDAAASTEAKPSDDPSSQWASRLGRKHRVLLAALSVVPMVLCVADWDIWVLGYVAWIPMLAAVEATRPRQALFWGWLVGTFTVFWGFFWITELLVKFAGFPVALGAPITFLFASYHGLLWGLAMMVTVWLTGRTRLPLWITAPLSWVAIEATLPNIFPIYMAQGWAAAPTLIQTAELGGVTTVSFVMVATNAALYVVITRYWRERVLDRPAAIAAAGLIAVVPAYGAMRMAQVQSTMDAAPHLKVGVVQGNMSIAEMTRPRERDRAFMGEIRKSRELEAEGAEVILWGETAYPNSRIFHRESKHEPPQGHPWRLHQGFTAPLIVGAVTRENVRGANCGSIHKCWNTALLIGEDGEILDRYDKVYRLVFGEYAPIVDPEWYLQQIPSASHLQQGEGPKALSLGEHRLGAFICYEDILPRYVRETAQQGVHAFVNLTNDAWFGKTHEPAQHLGLAVFRAVEHRKGMLRSVNTGISTYVDPLGRQVHRTTVTDPDIDGPQEPDGFVADVPMMDPEAKTPYMLTGELFNGLCIFAIVVLGWRFRRDEAEAA
jgi:apolipoprotein N-acyltransferase